jgi:DMSO/TMAO reductase YedYZ molybdopterin-dependent catalytic subunit
MGGPPCTEGRVKSRRSRLIVAKQSPPNGEAPLAELRAPMTPVAAFFVRSHFPVPQIDASKWRLVVEGLVGERHEFTYGELREMSRATVVATLECAGNGRRGFKVPAQGELQWGPGAVGTARWSGVTMRAVLERCRMDKSATELVIEGSDSGNVVGVADPIRFSRSLPLHKALHRDTIIALQMNRRRLTPDHGYPARLVVPGWYGMASVKWLSRITVVSGGPYNAFFNGVKYVYVREEDGREVTEPVREVRVKSLITHPLDGDSVRMGEPVTIAGRAWSGSGKISSVEVDLGKGWEKATTEGAEAGRFAWVAWRKRWVPDRRGEVAISARATDEGGSTQPLEPMENRFQYGYNAAQRVRVRVT